MHAAFMRQETRAAVAAARAGLALARERVGADRIQAKAGVDIVTEADIATEREIRRILVEACPEIPIVGEEDGGEASEGGSYWLVDPICGTRNYASNLAAWCTNVVLVEAGHATVAVVGDGGTGEISCAERGAGAWSDRGPLRAREGTVLGLELGGKPPYHDPIIAPLVATIAADSRYYIRLFGTTLSLAKVASGDLAGLILITETPDALHTAAGCLLAEEAGALVTDRSGAPWTLDTTSLVLAASAAVQADLLRWLDD